MALRLNDRPDGLDESLGKPRIRVSLQSEVLVAKGSPRLRRTAIALTILACLAAACHRGETSELIEGNFYASAILAQSAHGPLIIGADSQAKVSGVEPETGAISWEVQLPAPAGQEPVLLPTPVATDAGLVVVYHTRSRETKTRTRHRAVVIDLDRGEVDPSFPMVEFDARIPLADGSGLVPFDPAHSLARAALVHGRTASNPLGFVYVGFGNRADIQPWHGWVFELDLTAWESGDAEDAISATLLVTPENHCPVEGQSGSKEMICGGGVWAPAGPLLVQARERFELFVPTGNGQLDLARRDYANTLMRMGPGLDFDPECDLDLCRGFEQANPAEACMASCRNLFIPRELPGDPPLRPASGVCDGLTFMECIARVDYDFGANSAVQIELSDGRRVMVQPGKDGHVYLFDAERLGELYDRKKIVAVCGAPGDLCGLNQWRGMIVTQPTVTEVDGHPVVLIPTFMPDRTHPAGVAALRVRAADPPTLELLWKAPRVDSQEALERFRFYPSRIALSSHGPDQVAWLVDGGTGDGERGLLRRLKESVDDWRGVERGTLMGIRVRDGEILHRIRLKGRGRRFVLPLVHNDRLYFPTGKSIEVYDLSSSSTPRG